MKMTRFATLSFAVVVSVAQPLMAHTVPRASGGCDPANTGHISGAVALSRSLHSPDSATQVCWSYVSAMAGNARGQSDWGYALLNGKEVAENDTEALVWNQKSALQGDAMGAYNVSIAYENGYGTAVDTDKAKYWMIRAMKDPQIRALVQQQNERQQVEDVIKALSAPRPTPKDRHFCYPYEHANNPENCSNY